MDISALNQLTEHLDRADFSSIYLYGANDIASSLIVWARRKGIIVTAVFDQKANSQDSSHEGVPVISPNLVKDRDIECIVITAFACSQVIRSTLESVREEYGLTFKIIDSNMSLCDVPGYQELIAAMHKGQYLHSNQLLFTLLKSFPDNKNLWLLAAENYQSLGELELSAACRLCGEWLY